MRTHFTLMLLAALLASFSAQAQDALSTAAPQATPSAAADLPFGTGYEARQRQAKQARAVQEQQARDQTQAA